MADENGETREDVQFQHSKHCALLIIKNEKNCFKVHNWQPAFSSDKCLSANETKGWYE